MEPKKAKEIQEDLKIWRELETEWFGEDMEKVARGSNSLYVKSSFALMGDVKVEKEHFLCVEMLV